MSYWFRNRHHLEKAYNPDQARDSNGRWGSGGGASRVQYTPTPNLSADHRAIETRAARIVQNFAQAKADYDKLPDSKGGLILNTDIARELSPDYNRDRSLSATVHEPSSAFIRELYKDKLAESPTGTRLPMVLFTAGGTGAGKSTAIEQIPEMKALADSAQFIYDTNMNTYGSALDKINMALAAEKDVHVTMVQRDPIDALVNGALSRSESQARKLGIDVGRTVPLDTHIKTHVGAATTFEQLQAHFKGDDRVQFDLIDNSNGKGGARLAPLDSLKHYDAAALTTAARAALESEHDHGRISDKTYAGFKDY